MLLSFGSREAAVRKAPDRPILTSKRLNQAKFQGSRHSAASEVAVKSKMKVKRASFDFPVKEGE